MRTTLSMVETVEVWFAVNGFYVTRELYGMVMRTIANMVRRGKAEIVREGNHVRIRTRCLELVVYCDRARTCSSSGVPFTCSRQVFYGVSIVRAKDPDGDDAVLYCMLTSVRWDLVHSPCVRYVTTRRVNVKLEALYRIVAPRSSQAVYVDAFGFARLVKKLIEKYGIEKIGNVAKIGSIAMLIVEHALTENGTLRTITSLVTFCRDVSELLRMVG